MKGGHKFKIYIKKENQSKLIKTNSLIFVLSFYFAPRLQWSIVLDRKHERLNGWWSRGGRSETDLWIHIVL